MTIITKYENIKLWANSLYLHITDYFYWHFIESMMFYKSFRFVNTAIYDLAGVLLKLLTGMFFQRGLKNESWCGNENHSHYHLRKHNKRLSRKRNY